MEKIGFFFFEFRQATRETRLLTPEEKLAVLVNSIKYFQEVIKSASQVALVGAHS
jgi:hypothetical protein